MVATEYTVTNSTLSALDFDYDNRSTTPLTDDLITARAYYFERIYPALQAGTDRFGLPMHYAGAAPRHGDSLNIVRMEFYGVPNARGGGLEYLQLGYMSPGMATEFSGPLYFGLGRPQEWANLPVSGAASFTGMTRGGYNDGAGAAFSTMSDVTLTVNFASGAVSGATSNLRAVNAAGVAVTPSGNLNFTFTATPQTERYQPRFAMFTGAAANGNMQGVVEGYYYGEPNGAPAEIGIRYNLQSPTITALRMYGMGGLKIDTAIALIPPAAPAAPVYSPCSVGHELQCGARISLEGPNTVRAFGNAFQAAALMTIPYLIDRRGQFTATPDDDVLTLSIPAGINVVMQEFRNFTPYTDAFGGAARFAEAKIQLNSRLDIFEVQSALQNALDFIQVGRFSGNYSTGFGGVSYFAMPNNRATPIMPTTGTARFVGVTRGDYVDAANKIYRTASDVSLTANFATASVTGSATNFRIAAPAVAGTTARPDLDFTFSGAITGGGFTGPANNAALQGTVTGQFAGSPNAGPREVGLTYRLTPGGGAEQLPALFGAGGLRAE